MLRLVRLLQNWLSEEKFGDLNFKTWAAIFFTWLLVVSPFQAASAKISSFPIDQPCTFSYQLLPQEINAYPSPFSPLTEEEKKTNSGKELLCGMGFLKQGDLFQAISTLKRAQIFAQDENSFRLQQIEYTLIFAYYMAEHYKEVVETYSKSSLKSSKEGLKSTKELALMLYDSYLRLNRNSEAAAVLSALKAPFPKTAKKLTHYSHFSSCSLEKLPQGFQRAYMEKAKSPQKAALFQALLPGAGYMYVGQNTTAFTSFMMNALFIAAAYEFFHAGQTAAGVITAGFECGWYVGGIYGAHIAAKEHNRILYMQLSQNSLHAHKLFPILQFNYAF